MSQRCQEQKWSDRAGAMVRRLDMRLRYCGTREVVCNTISQRPSRFSYMLVVKAVKLTASPFLDFPCTLSIPTTHATLCARWICGSFIDTEISAKRSKVPSQLLRTASHPTIRTLLAGCTAMT